MPQLGPHISIADEELLARVFQLTEEEIETWPEDVRSLAAGLACELFLVRYNPFIDAAWVRENVKRRLSVAKPTLSGAFPSILTGCVNRFWERYDQDENFKKAMLERLREFMPDSSIDTEPNSRVECSTDATDLRLDLPMVVLFPETAEQIKRIVLLANELGFGIVPRGGGTGLTGGAIPGGTRTVVLSLARFKKIVDVDAESKTITAQAGVLTLDAIKAAAAKDLLFTVDPASKAASSIGGNVSENSGGPFAFEYGCTIDNILKYRMVTPSGEVVEVVRVDHPRHKIFPDEEVKFEIRSERGEVKETITLSGAEVRKPGLGKDVSNKFLGGLPGVQKEGVDGIIIDATFICYHKPGLSRVMVLEFFGRSMHGAMLVIKDVVGLRDRIREEGDKVKVSALEEFGPKYVRAIEYDTKSETYEGSPISVLIIQLDGDDAEALDWAVGQIEDIVSNYDNVDIFVAGDEKQAELYWEDRHKLSAIARRTSGFKINEDVVIPLEVIPEFAEYLENMNLIYLAKAYRKALAQVLDLPGVSMSDEYIEMEREVAVNVLQAKLSAKDLSDQEFETQIHYFFKDLENRYPKYDREIQAIYEDMCATRVEIANHMHAGDGNCHVNFPVNSNDPVMMANVHHAAEEVMAKVLELGGEVSGEHGIGITKIGFLSEDKIRALKNYKLQVDPRNIFNPGKLTQKLLPVAPYTFSFNRLIQDLNKTALRDKERLTNLLKQIQSCTRCGKCKQVCAMYDPAQGLLNHPRNKNITLGALIEAIYYSQYRDGTPDTHLLARLRKLMEHCTACGKCMSVCPIKIDSARAALDMRAFLEYKGQSGHKIKAHALNWLAQEPEKRIPVAAKIASAGQFAQNQFVRFVPAKWREKAKSPVFRGKGPVTELKNLYETMEMDKGSIFLAEDATDTVFYFPGCGAGVFSRSTGMAAIFVLLTAKLNVIVPDKHLCCGYPLLSAGLAETYNTNRHRTMRDIQDVMARAGDAGLSPSAILTGCGTCRHTLSEYDFEQEIGRAFPVMDVTELVLDNLPEGSMAKPGKVVYHAACHAERQDAAPAKAAEKYRSALAAYLGEEVSLSPGCCGESGMGAMTSPEIYNRVRGRKMEQLKADLKGTAKKTPVLVGCPSCKMGIKRSLMAAKKSNPVYHVLEHLAYSIAGRSWKKQAKALAANRIETPTEE